MLTTYATTQCRGKAVPYPPVGGAAIRRGPTMCIVLLLVS